MARILATGIATLDIINAVEQYPPEDSEVRALGQRICRGGNATNTLVVLSQLGHDCAWAGVLSDEPDAGHIRNDLARYAIDTAGCRVVEGGKVPTSYITLSRATGSRTIIHYRDLPEFAFEDFRRIGLRDYQWLHFEGRAVTDTARMLRLAAEQAPDTPRSVEIEKPRDGIETLFEHADVILFSRVFARSKGFTAPFPFLRQLHVELAHADLVCAWGEEGAYMITRDGIELHSPAFPPLEVVDTLGAGDTFNAGIIHARVSGKPWGDSLQTACRLAGRKVGQLGLERLALI